MQTLSPLLVPLLLAPAFGLMVLEAQVAKRRRQRIHARSTTYSNLGCGALRLGCTALVGGSLLALYHAVWTHLAPYPLRSDSWLTYLVGFLLFDLGYYVMHRASHHVPLLWAVHSVHHDTRDFNLTVGVRAGILGPLTSFPFYLPLALLGVPTTVYAVVSVVGHITMFLAHARFVGRLGPVEFVLNTPRHHRLHHSREQAHYGLNYGGVLILWDRLLGTYGDADGVEFGLDAEPQLNPVKANLEPLRAWWHDRSDPNADPTGTDTSRPGAPTSRPLG